MLASFFCLNMFWLNDFIASPCFLLSNIDNSKNRKSRDENSKITACEHLVQFECRPYLLRILLQKRLAFYMPGCYEVAPYCKSEYSPQHFGRTLALIYNLCDRVLLSLGRRKMLRLLHCRGVSWIERTIGQWLFTRNRFWNVLEVYCAPWSL